MLPTIRLATETDIPAIAELIPLAVRGLSGPFYSPREIEVAVAHVFGVDRQLIYDRTYYVAEIDGRVVAAGGWSRRKTMFGGDQTGYKVQDDPLLDPVREAGREAGRIRAFYVHPDFARRGLGRAILTTCEAAAGDAGFTRLEMIATLPGVPLYAACGYERIDAFDIDMPDGSKLPASRMGKSI